MPVATAIEPFALIVIALFAAEKSVVSDGKMGKPFRVSFAKTEIPKQLDPNTFMFSSRASIVVVGIVTQRFALLQLFGLAFSQMV